MDYIQHYQHDQHHEWYQNQRTPDGKSCCNNNDCRPAYDWEVVEGGVRMKIDSGWVFVPEAKVQNKSPDGNAHYCGIKNPTNGNDIVFCGFISLGV